MIEAGDLGRLRDERYAGWSGELGSSILDGSLSLADLEQRVTDQGLDPRPVSGQQERLENLVNQRIWAVERGG